MANAGHQATEWFAGAMTEDGKDESKSVTRVAASQLAKTQSELVQKLHDKIEILSFTKLLAYVIFFTVPSSHSLAIGAVFPQIFSLI